MRSLSYVISTALAAVCFSLLASMAFSNERLAAAEREVAFIEDIQESLYVLGYLDIEDIDGSSGPKTAMAVRLFTSDQGMTRSSKLTEELRQLLIDMAFPDLPPDPELIGALTVADDLKWGTAHGRFTSEVAESVAIRRCLEASRTDRNCGVHMHIIHGHQWSVTMSCGRQYSTSTESTESKAAASARKHARDNGNRSACTKLVALNASFGRYVDEEEISRLNASTAEIPGPLVKPGRNDI